MYCLIGSELKIPTICRYLTSLQVSSVLSHERKWDQTDLFSVAGSFSWICMSKSRCISVLLSSLGVTEIFWFTFPSGTRQRGFQESCHVQGSAEEEQRSRQGEQEGFRYVEDQEEKQEANKYLIPQRLRHICFGVRCTLISDDRNFVS